MKRQTLIMIVIALAGLMASPHPDLFAGDAVAGPRDLALTFVSPFDGSPQPYRLYLPSAYDGTRVLPLLVALHGTGGNQNTYFDDEGYHQGIYKTEAEKRGVMLLCPHGTDGEGLPTEWRGVGELHVLGALADVQRRFRVDPDRIICTGQSMGGTGTTYLCCRYPDLFAAGIPLASTYGHVSLVTNLRDVPMFYVQGGKDWPIYAKTGPIPITEQMRRLGYKGSLWMIPDSPHDTMGVSTERVFDWAVQQTRVAHPRHITHRAYFPPHGRAWWVDIQQCDRPGWFAEVDARIEDGNRILLTCRNTSRVVLRPDSVLLDLERPVVVMQAGGEVFRGACGPGQQIVLNRSDAAWRADVEPRHVVSRTDWKTFVVGVVDQPPTWEGGPETTLGNWLTDAMRDISGADVAICTKGHYRVGEKMRGAAIQPGQTLHLMDLINWLRPGDTALATFTLRGSDLLKIIELNIRDQPTDDMFLVQVSGCRYRFDRRRPRGKRVVATDIQPEREYKIVCNSSDLTRGDTLQLGEFFEKLNHQLLEPNLLSCAWRFIAVNGGRVAAPKFEGRLSEVLP